MFEYGNCDVCDSLTTNIIMRSAETYRVCDKDSCNDEIEKRIIVDQFTHGAFDYIVKGQNEFIIDNNIGYCINDNFHKLYVTRKDVLIPINYNSTTMKSLSSKYYDLDELIKLNFHMSLFELNDISKYLDEEKKREFLSIKNMIYNKTYFNRCIICLLILYKRDNNILSILPNDLFYKIIDDHIFN